LDIGYLRGLRDAFGNFSALSFARPGLCPYRSPPLLSPVEFMEADTDQILDLIAKEGLVDRTTLTPETKIADLNIPSLEMINILFAFEDRFGVDVDPSEIQHAKTMGDIIDVVRAHVRAPKSP
jgi:acyl carrier protein